MLYSCWMCLQVQTRLWCCQLWCTDSQLSYTLQNTGVVRHMRAVCSWCALTVWWLTLHWADICGKANLIKQLHVRPNRLSSMTVKCWIRRLRCTAQRACSKHCRPVHMQNVTKLLSIHHSSWPTAARPVTLFEGTSEQLYWKANMELCSIPFATGLVWWQVDDASISTEIKTHKKHTTK